MEREFLYPFAGPLIEAVLVERYVRFLADVRFPDGSVVTAHCVNPGRMEGIVRPGDRVWVRHCPGPGRKLHWTWELCEAEGRRIGVNTSLPNQIVKRLLQDRLLPGFEAHRGFQEEKAYAENSRVDFLVETEQGPHYLEVKNCHLVYPDGGAYFPDSVSARAARHVEELAHEVKRGARATVLFIVQHDEARFVRPSDLHDPAFARAARSAASNGVRFDALVFSPGVEGLRLRRQVPVDLEPYALEDLARWREINRPFGGWRSRPKP